MIRHIVFDIGRVLLQWDPERPYRELIPDPERRRWFLTNVCSPEWNTEQDRGRSWAEGMDLLIARHPQEEALIRAFLACWDEMVPAEVPQTPGILRRLVADGWDVTMLTNFHQDTFPRAVARFPVLKIPRGVTVSGRVGMIKPQREIYRHHEAAFGLDPGAILFFDDSERNVAAARDCGWNARLFVDAEGMRGDLEAHGIAA